jgi:DNA-binding response OmpR family regulator
LGNSDSQQPLYHQSVVSPFHRHRTDRILLVEEDHVLAEMYELSLLLHGFLVDVAPDGEAGIQRVARGQHPDAIVLDIGLPRINRRAPRRDGLAMLSALRSTSTTKFIPVVVLASDPQDFADVMELGATVCLARWRSTTNDLTGQLDEILHPFHG